MKKINEAREADGTEEKVNEDDTQLFGEAKTAMSDVVFMNISSSDRLTFEDRVSMCEGHCTTFSCQPRTTHGELCIN